MPDDVVTLAAVGDLMLQHPIMGQGTGGAFETDEFTPLRSADLALGNLEVPLSRRGIPAAKPMVFRAEPECAGTLREVGFSVLGLANNHCLDFGGEALEDTVASLDSLGILRCGAGRNLTEAMKPAEVDVRGTRFAFFGLAATLPVGFAANDSRPGVAPIQVKTLFEADPEVLAEQPGSAPAVRTLVVASDQARALAAVSEAKRSNDVVVVSIHWGVANGEQLAGYQQPLAHALIDAGADVVIGHHPHVLQGIECYRGRPIFYSLGHFVVHPELFGQSDWNAQLPHPEWLYTACVRLQFEKGTLAGMELVPYFLDTRGNPHVARSRLARFPLDRLARLSFPMGTRLELRDERGWLSAEALSNKAHPVVQTRLSPF